MVKGTTKSGFAFEIPKEKFNKWQMLKNLRKIDKGELELVVDVAEDLLDENLEKLENHIAELEGDVTIESMVSELQDIMASSKESKN